MNKPKRVQVYTGDVGGAEVSRAEYYYDRDINGDVRALDDAPLRGGLVMEDRFLLGAANPHVQTNYWYDNYGNLIQAADPNGHATMTLYYTPHNLYPKQVCNALSQCATTQYYGVDSVAADNGLAGQVKKVIDPNGASTEYRYDKLGRLTSTTRPYDDPDSWPTTQFAYIAPQPAEAYPYGNFELGVHWGIIYGSGVAFSYAPGQGRGGSQALQIDTSDTSDHMVGNTSYAGSYAGWQAGQTFWIGAWVRGSGTVELVVRPRYCDEYTNGQCTGFYYPPIAQVASIVANGDWQFIYGQVRLPRLVDGDFYDASVGFRTTTTGTVYIDDVMIGLPLTPLKIETKQREVSNQEGVLTTYEFYDGLGRLQQTRAEAESGQQLVTNVTYDALGRAQYTYMPTFEAATNDFSRPAGWDTRPRTTTQYDALGRVKQVTNPDGTQTVHTYGVVQDSGVWLTYDDVLDANRHRIQHRYDVFGQLVKAYEITGDCSNSWPGYTCGGSYTTPWGVYAVTSYTYDTLGNLKQVQDAAGNLTHMDYDTLGRKTGMSDPDMGQWYYQYDAASNLVRQTDAKNQRTCFYYDQLNRLKGKTFSSGTADCPGDPDYAGYTVKYWYDSTTGGNKGVGQRTSMSNKDSGGYTIDTTSWTYDLRGRVTQESKTVTGTQTFNTSYTYDAMDRVVDMAYPSGEVVRHTYNAAAQLEQASSIDYTLNYATGLQYNELGQLKRVQYSNGLETQYNYFGLDTPQWGNKSYGQLFQTCVIAQGASCPHNPSTPPPVSAKLNLSYWYDNVGNVQAIRDYTNDNQVQWFTYDALDRLTRGYTEAQGGGTDQGRYDESYTYNTIGNLTTKGVGNYTYPPSGSTSVQPHAVRRVTGSGGSSKPVQIRAYSTPCNDGVGATMQLWVNGALTQTWTNMANSWTTYSKNVTLSGNDQIEVVFTNDCNSGGYDRNLYVDYVVVDGRTIQAEGGAAVIDRGSGSAAFDGLDVIAGQQTIAWNAALRLVVGATAYAACYDANGNMTCRVQDGAATFMSYDAENRLSVVTNTVTGQVTRFYYDADGQRVARLAPDGDRSAYIGPHFEVDYDLPDAPSYLGATASGTQINLSWADNSANESGFRIERSLNNINWTWVHTTTANVTSYPNTGLDCGKIYYYRVRAYNGAGHSSYSNTANATVVPCTPINLGATGSGTQINLSWTDNSTGESGFRIERSLNNINWTWVHTTTANVTSYLNTGLDCGKVYYYHVRAYNGAGYSNYSSAVNAATVPCAPSGLNAAGSGTQINLSWTDNSTGESGFRIERSPDGSSWNWVYTTTANVTSYPNTGLDCGKVYYYHMRAYNGAGYSNYSSAVNAATVPCTPIGLNATAAGSTQINLSWTDNSTGETGFRIERSLDGSNWTWAYTTTANVTSYPNTGLDCNKTYYYHVRAYNASGNSSYGNTTNATTFLCAPSNLTATGSGLQINLSWNDNSTNEAGFKIQRLIGSTWTDIATVGANIKNYTHSGLTCNASYSYRVYAYLGAMNSDNSNTKNASTIPCAPSGLGATATGSTQIHLSWNDNSTNEAGFAIQRLDGLNWINVATVGANITSYTDSGLTCNTSYSYRVYAYNGAGPSGNSNTASATTLCAPAELTAVAVGSGGGGIGGDSLHVELSWMDTSNSEEGFTIWRYINMPPYTQIGEVGANVTVFSDTNVICGTTYYYYVQAYNRLDTSDPSNIASATPCTNTPVPPPPPANLTAQCEETIVYLAWTAQGDIGVTFNVYYRPGSNNEFTQIASGLSETSYTAEQGSGEYAVTAVNLYGESGFSNIATAECKDVTASLSDGLLEGSATLSLPAGAGNTHVARLAPDGDNTADALYNSINTDTSFNVAQLPDEVDGTTLSVVDGTTLSVVDETISSVVDETTPSVADGTISPAPGGGAKPSAMPAPAARLTEVVNHRLGQPAPVLALAPTSDNITWRSYYYAGSQRVAMRERTISTNVLYYLHADHLGSASLATTNGGVEVTNSRMRYKPYGEQRGTSGNGLPTDYRFTGQKQEAALGLYFYNARYYDPLLGRFLSADTIVPSPANPQSLNRYSYVSNNPLKYTDPTGHYEAECQYDVDCNINGQFHNDVRGIWVDEDVDTQVGVTYERELSPEDAQQLINFLDNASAVSLGIGIGGATTEAIMAAAKISTAATPLGWLVSINMVTTGYDLQNLRNDLADLHAAEVGATITWETVVLVDELTVETPNGKTVRPMNRFGPVGSGAAFVFAGWSKVNWAQNGYGQSNSYQQVYLPVIAGQGNSYQQIYLPVIAR